MAKNIFLEELLLNINYSEYSQYANLSPVLIRFLKHKIVFKLQALCWAYMEE